VKIPGPDLGLGFFAALGMTKKWMQRLETGTGFAGAKLSEVLPSARVARFVRMTEGAEGVRGPSAKRAFARMGQDDTGARSARSLSPFVLVSFASL
jgi:hypothetical protein